MSTNATPQPSSPEEQLRAWQRLQQELGVRGPEDVLDMIRSLEAQLVALYTEIDPAGAP